MVGCYAHCAGLPAVCYAFLSVPWWCCSCRCSSTWVCPICPTCLLVVALYSDAQIGGRLISWAGSILPTGVLWLIVGFAPLLLAIEDGSVGMQFFEIRRYPFSLIVDGICGSLIVGDDAYSVIEIFGIIILCGQDEFPRHIHAPIFKNGFEQPLSICGL